MREVCKILGYDRYAQRYQMAGKGQIRQQAAMWRAMLMSAGLPPTKQIVIHGFITVGGEKMLEIRRQRYRSPSHHRRIRVDALRYYLARHIHPFEDSDFYDGKFKDAYNANLANGLGNLAARIKLAEKNLSDPVDVESVPFAREFTSALDSYDFNAAFDYAWGKDTDARPENFRDGTIQSGEGGYGQGEKAHQGIGHRTCGNRPDARTAHPLDKRRHHQRNHREQKTRQPFPAQNNHSMFLRT